MKKSIKHLPKRTQEELEALLSLIKHHIPWCSMVVLYGSYARGSYVLWDQKIEFGIPTTYQSDLDIMIVCEKMSVKHVEDKLRTKVTKKYHTIFKNRRHASPQFIVEYIDTLNEKLEKSQYFFTEIVKDCIMLYDSKEHKLVKPRELSYKEIKEYAIQEYNIFYPDGCDFLKIGYYNLNEGIYKLGSFILHQACERFYNAISLVFMNYRPKNHKLDELGAMVKSYSRELSTLFLLNTDFEKRCYDLLCRAYIEARYNGDFVIAKEELEQMLKWIEELKTIAEKICLERIAYYDTVIEGK